MDDDALLDGLNTGNDIGGNAKPFTASRRKTLYAGEAAADHFHVRPGYARVPDLVGIAQHGVVYTSGGKGKIAEHGDPDAEDLDGRCACHLGDGAATRAAPSPTPRPVPTPATPIAQRLKGVAQTGITDFQCAQVPMRPV